MAVHRVADEIVRWATGRPGIAATRFLFLNNNDKRVYRVDSDGHGIAPISPANVLAVLDGDQVEAVVSAPANAASAASAPLPSVARK